MNIKEIITNIDGVSPPIFFAASFRLPEKYCWRTLKLTFFSTALLFFSACFLDPLVAYKKNYYNVKRHGSKRH